ncbi:uncharacterized protein P884DRAFT_259094 [Thermothelomyces heterothallicus CBS 202.75]|uniref:uncharacterized protein n=1 Tax=Thermothelomyces heterothallicus CBS 202.75 TaxID=1149848 RepID=UPI0037434D0B
MAHLVVVHIHPTLFQIDKPKCCHYCCSEPAALHLITLRGCHAVWCIRTGRQESRRRTGPDAVTMKQISSTPCVTSCSESAGRNFWKRRKWSHGLVHKGTRTCGETALHRGYLTRSPVRITMRIYHERPV